MPVYEYPADKNGNMLEYESSWLEKSLVPNAPFRSAMKYLNFERGRSSVRIILEGDDGRRWSMTLGEYMKILSTHTLVNGSIPEKEWHVVKRGANYGLERYNA